MPIPVHALVSCSLIVFYCLRPSWKIDVLSNEWPLEIKYFFLCICYYYNFFNTILLKYKSSVVVPVKLVILDNRYMNMMFVGDNVVLIVCWCQLCHGMMVFQLSKLSLCQCISVLLR